MANELGSLIAEETKRAEADFTALRNRGQAVLTVSGGLVTLLGAVLALAVGKDKTIVLAGFTGVAAIVALVAFVVATVVVLLMFVPSQVEVPDASALATYVKDDWDAVGWEQQVATLLTTYLTSLRRANAHLARLLILSISAEVIGIVAVAVMAVSIVVRS